MRDRLGVHVMFDSQPYALKAALLHLPGFLLHRQLQRFDLFFTRLLSGSHFHPLYITILLNAS